MRSEHRQSFTTTLVAKYMVSSFVLDMFAHVRVEIAFCSPKTQPLLEQVCNEKIEQIEKKIADLNGMLDELRQFYQSCACESSNNIQCSLLDCFENEWECCDNSNGRKK